MQAVILDVDGTLVDSERDGHRVAFNLAFEELGLPYRWDVEPYGQLLEVAGGQRRIDGYLENQGIDAEERHELASRLHARKTELFQELVTAGKVEPRPGVSKLLESLEHDGIRLAVATTGSRAWVEPLLDLHFGLDRFEVIITGDEAPDRKPDPSAFVATLDALDLPPRAVVAVEDSANGLRAALAADLACVMVVNDYTRNHDLTGAALVVDSFENLDVDTLARLTGTTDDG